MPKYTVAELIAIFKDLEERWPDKVFLCTTSDLTLMTGNINNYDWDQKPQPKEVASFKIPETHITE